MTSPELHELSQQNSRESRKSVSKKRKKRTKTRLATKVLFILIHAPIHSNKADRNMLCRVRLSLSPMYVKTYITEKIV